MSTTTKLAQWQQDLSNTINSLAALLDFLQLSEEALIPVVAYYALDPKTGHASTATPVTDSSNSSKRIDTQDVPDLKTLLKTFPIRVPYAFAARMRKNDPFDPLLLQVLPLAQESQWFELGQTDPTHEHPHIATTGLVHRYQGRALLVSSSACAIHCRYCFRRHFPYQEHRLDQEMQAVHEHLQAHTDIEELILSGGDPLTQKTSYLQKYNTLLASNPHIERFRIHSRIPIVLPNRIDNELLAWLTELDLEINLVLHCNHAQEIDSQVTQTIEKLQNAGVRILNQAVLLKGINDTLPAQRALAKRLSKLGIQYYYLHLLDPVAGGLHYEVSQEHGQALMRALTEQLPGYMLPRLVKETAGAVAKTTLTDHHTSESSL